MGEFSITHLLLVAVLLLFFFGPSRLPGLGQSIGKAIRGFKDGLNDTEKDKTAAQTTPPAGQINPSAPDTSAQQTAEKTAAGEKKS